ncbi:MAG: hypothetical protein SynsKO_28670 [Synoicihabitans sp.]
MSNYYEFGKKAERLVLVELSHQGEIRPMKVSDPSTGDDELGFDPVQLEEFKPEEFTFWAETDSVDPANNSTGFLSIDLFGWRVGQVYLTSNLQVILNGQDLFGGVGGPEFKPKANAVGSIPLSKVTYRFERVAPDRVELSWRHEGTASRGRGSLTLSDSLEYAYVVLRLNGKNTGGVTFDDLVFGESECRRFVSTP